MKNKFRNHTSDGWILLQGGNVNTVYKKDGLIRRQLSSWSPAVHELLFWLELQQVSGVPQLLAVDEEGGVEYLSFIEGEPIFRPWNNIAKSDEWMAELGSWLRQYHQAVIEFRLRENSAFVWGPKTPEAAWVVCHGDLGPWNCLQFDGRFHGVIDWDLARFGNPLDDLAQMALEAVPLRQSTAGTMGTNPDMRNLDKRLAILCGEYGRCHPKELIQHLLLYLERIAQEIANLAEKNIEPFASFVTRGFVTSLEQDRRFILTHWTNK